MRSFLLANVVFEPSDSQPEGRKREDGQTRQKHEADRGKQEDHHREDRQGQAQRVPERRCGSGIVCERFV